MQFHEEGEHSKGHSTQGEHNIHKKDEYEKKQEFYDESHEGGEHEKHGEYFHEDDYHKASTYMIFRVSAYTRVIWKILQNDIYTSQLTATFQINLLMNFYYKYQFLQIFWKIIIEIPINRDCVYFRELL